MGALPLAQSAGGRLDRYTQYVTIDTTRPEAASALDAWADIVCTGGVGDEGRRRQAFEPEVEGDGKCLKAAMPTATSAARFPRGGRPRPPSGNIHVALPFGELVLDILI